MIGPSSTVMYYGDVQEAIPHAMPEPLGKDLDVRLNADASLVVSCMTSMMTILNNDGKTSLSRPPDIEGTEEIHTCVVTDS